MNGIFHKRCILPILILTGAMLSGCGTNQVSYGGLCVTCMDNPVTGEPMNYDPSAHSNKGVAGGTDHSLGARSVPHTLARESIELSFGRDVDSTAMRLKNAFGYMTQEEAVAEMGNAGKMMFAGPGYAYSGTPGALYVMKTQYADGDLVTRVTKHGSGAKAVITYDQKANSGADFNAVMRQIKTTAEKALQ